MGASQPRREVDSLGANEDDIGMDMVSGNRMVYRTSVGKIHASVPSCRGILFLPQMFYIP